MLEALRALFGGAPAPAPVAGGPPPARLPNEAEIAAARASGLDYGDPSASFFQPGAKVRQTATPQDAVSLVNSRREKSFDEAAPAYTDTPLANHLFQTWLATKQSPIAALGFDPRNTVVMPASPLPGQPQPETAPMPPARPAAFGPSGNPELGPAPEQALNKAQLTLGGAYSPSQDAIWTDGRSGSNLLHESMHRGIQKLRAAGKLPQDGNEEMHVRNLMRRGFGDVEAGAGPLGDKQIASAKQFEDRKLLDALEAAAAQMIAQERPRGPR